MSGSDIPHFTLGQPEYDVVTGQRESAGHQPAKGRRVLDRAGQISCARPATARSVDLEDSNLFALNRFPGYDRWEDASRITYGVDWAFDRPNLSIAATIGQSYRIQRHPSIFPEGTGLSDRFSDIVGRTRVRYGRLIDHTHRYRVDKNSLAVRRNELDLTVGGARGQH